MLINVERIDDHYLKCIFNVPFNDFEQAKSKIFMETKERYKIPGFETGKIPKTTLENYYGEEIFYEDTINFLIKEEFTNMNNRYKKYSITEDKVKDINILQLEKGKDVKFELIIEYKGDVK